MKKYLREIEISSTILMLISCVGFRFLHMKWTIWVCIIGLIMWLLQVAYKAFNWNEYARDNKQNIVMILFVIALLFYIMLRQ